MHIANLLTTQEISLRIPTRHRERTKELLVLPTADVVEANGLKLDDSSHRVSAGEREIALGPTEYRLLHFFMTHPERVFSRGQLLDRVWGGNTYVEERTVDVHIRRLRKALEPYLKERLVQTVRGSGYRFSTRDA